MIENDSLAADPLSPDEWASGWRPLAGAMVAIAAGYTTLTYTAGYLVKPIEEGTGWGRGQIALGTTLAMTVAALFMPACGWLVDRVGPRRVGLIATLCYAGSALLLWLLPASLATYYLLMAALGFFGVGTVSIVFAPIIAAKFSRHRGIALSIMMSGTAFLLVPLAPILIHIASSSGWQAGYAVLAVLAAGLGLPGVLTATANSSKMVSAMRASGIGLSVAVRSFEFWMLIGGVCFSCIALGGFINQFAAILSDSGMASTRIALLSSLFVLSVVFGRAVTGFLFDCCNAAHVAAAVMVVSAVGMILFVFAGTSFALSLVVAVMVGAAMGAEADISAYFAAGYFGLASYASIFGIIAACTAIFLGVGAFVMAHLFDWMGGYTEALVLNALLLTTSALFFMALRGRPFRGVGTGPTLVAA